MMNNLNVYKIVQKIIIYLKTNVYYNVQSNTTKLVITVNNLYAKMEQYILKNLINV